jgi:XRE family transcriptional regulator, regulator of sulfur utilization
MQLGKRLSRLRKSKGISQELLAENSSVSLRTIQRIETGNVTPRPHTIKTLAETLGVPMEDLYTPPSHTPEAPHVAIAKLRLMNFSALAGFVIPLSNVIIPTLYWNRNRSNALIQEAGKKIISFQLLWTLATVLLVFLIPFIQYSLLQSYVIGRFPPTFIVVYVAMLLVNLFFIIRTATQLQKRNLNLYAFIPALF